MIKNKSVKINAILNVARNFSRIFLPVVTVPYVTRVLQVENYGKVSFGSSIVSYFLLISALGINSYAVREMSVFRDDKEKISSFGNEMFSLNIMSTVISYILMFLLMFFWSIEVDKKKIIIIQSIIIILTTMGVEWIFIIYEDYLYITLRSIVVQFIALFAIFIFVKQENDYIKYTIITSVSNCLGYLFNFFYARKYINLKFIRNIDYKKHLKPIFILFANTALITIYLNSDVTMLGMIKDYIAVGLYEVSVKIYTIIKTLLSALIVVIIPKLSIFIGNNDKKSYDELLDNTLKSLITILFPSIIGLFMLSHNVILIVSGENYIKSTISLQILSISLIFAVFANFFVNAILITQKREKYVLYATFFSAGLNIILNIFFIPLWSQNGAAVTTLLAELSVLIISIFYSRDLFNLTGYAKTIKSVFVGCILVIVICIGIDQFELNLWFDTLLKIMISIIVYGIVQIILNCELFQKFIHIK